MHPERFSLPDNSLVTYVSEPALATGKPVISGESHMSDFVKSIMEDRWCRVFPERTIQFHSLPNVYVVGEGLIFDQKGRILDFSIQQNTNEQIEAARQQLHYARHVKQIRYHPGATLLCGKIGLSNYGHWLMEMLPSAFLAREWIALGWDVYVPKIYPWMHAVVDASFDLLSIDRQRTAYGDGSPWLFEDLVFVTGMSEVGLYYSHAAVRCMQHLAASVAAEGGQRVWIARTDEAGRHRSIREETELCDRLAKFGWTILHPSTMSLPEQIKACKGATHIAGVAGAGLTNAGFMSPGGQITCFMPCGMHDIFFLHLAHHARISYREVRCAVDHEGHLTIASDDVVAELSN